MNSTKRPKELIGMVHLKTLPGYPQHKSIEEVLRDAVRDAIALEKGGAHAILIENTNDDPHRILVGPETVAAFTRVALAIAENVRIPIGICVLWNDAKASLAVAKSTGATFVRIPVFTESVIASCGRIDAVAYEAIAYRQAIGAAQVRILADVHVKHASVLSMRPIGESAQEALSYCADGIIITGRFTGDAPQLRDLEAVRQANPHAHVAVGSGTSEENINELARYADSFIVGTSLKGPDGYVDSGKVRRLRGIVDWLNLNT